MGYRGSLRHTSPRGARGVSTGWEAPAGCPPSTPGLKRADGTDDDVVVDTMVLAYALTGAEPYRREATRVLRIAETIEVPDPSSPPQGSTPEDCRALERTRHRGTNSML